MHGPYCYACGQPEKGMIRQLASVLSDVLDTVFNIDSRVFRSLLPLYFRPGYLTLEYFAGRRVRYVTPFRLFFFLCLVAFFAIQIALNLERRVQFQFSSGITGSQRRHRDRADRQPTSRNARPSDSTASTRR